MSEHPGLKRVRVIVQRNGRTNPLTPEEQWQHVGDWYEYLSEIDVDDYPTLSSITRDWEEMSENHKINGASIFERGLEGRNTASTPFAALFYYIEMGFYPPPELMLSLLDFWNAYMHSCGRLSLEEAFLGRTVQKAGNYSKRSLAKMKRLQITWDFAALIRDGRSRKEAAEIVSNSFDGKPDADSILRMLRGFNGFRRGKPVADK